MLGCWAHWAPRHWRWLGSGGTLVLILAGAAVVSGLMLAGTALVLFGPNPTRPAEITHWMLGSLADRGWGGVADGAVCSRGPGALLSQVRALDAGLGDGQPWR